MSRQYLPTIGIEIHVQLATKSKMFCGCDNESRDALPNTNICPVCLALPGTLPVINRRAVELAIKLGVGINAKIARDTKFDRKNYFYPDSPKGYQISQYDQPIVYDGEVEILVLGEFKKIGVERAHMEEDAGKLVHPDHGDHSLVDLNRAGTPLVEIVSKPELHSPQEAKRYLQEIYNIVASLGISNGDMEHGNFKFDLNVSVSTDPEKLGTRTELKNLNSFRNAERALTYEIKRQVGVLEEGGTIDQETRGWNDAKSVTFSQRGKEQAHDYRYFPEPDLPPLKITREMIDEIKREVGVLPIEVRKELHGLALNVDEQDMLIGQPYLSGLFFEAKDILSDKKLEKKAINWLVGDYQAILTQKGVKQAKLTAANLASLISLVEKGTISSKIAKDIFAEVVDGKDPAAIIQTKGLSQLSDTSELETIIRELVEANPRAVADYRDGNQKVIGYFVGQVMKATKGQANPGVVNAILLQYLEG